MDRKCFETDESGHWYLIPTIEKELFDRLLHDDDETKFEDAFENTRLNMHISNYSFVDCKQID